MNDAQYEIATPIRVWHAQCQLIRKGHLANLRIGVIMTDASTFQSLLQLAVAMNLGFVAVQTIFGNSISKEKSRIDSLYKSASGIHEVARADDRFRDEIRSTFMKIIDLRKEISDTIVDMETFTYRTLRIVAVACALISFLLLSYISFNSSGIAVLWAGLMSIVLNLPFIVYVGYSWYYSVRKVSSLQTKRAKLDELLSSNYQKMKTA